MSRQWSAQQSAIFNWFECGAGHLVVKARAGTGKTTTIVEAVTRAPESSIIVCAFNKLIATELTERVSAFAPRIQAKTLHSLGYDCVRRSLGRMQIDADRGMRLAKLVCDGERKSAMVVQRIASLAKGAYPFPASLEGMTDFVLDSDIDLGDFEPEWIADRAYAAMQEAAQYDGTCDFDDMVWLPAALGLARPRFKLSVVDEAQDMNASQILLAQALTDGRICVVGDDRQAIYGFRGADSGSIDRLKRELNATELSLTVTYRCPKTVVELAREIVPDYQAADSAPDGSVSTVSELDLLSKVRPNDFVLSRTNAPLVRVCLLLIRRGMRARIQGRDVAAQIKTLTLKVSGGENMTIPGFAKALEQWREREMNWAAKLEGDRGERKRQLIEDQCDTLLALCEGADTLFDIHSRLETLFSSEADADRDYVVLSSVHKSKGLERERVWLLEESFKHGAIGEEANIRYVAITRSKSVLQLVQPAA